MKDYRKMRQAYSAFSAGYNNPGAGGFSDMALTEGAQRILNPGATVRQGTIKNMQDAAGWLQSFDPSFQWDKAVQGNKFSDDARARLKSLVDGVYNDATNNVAPTLDGMKAQASMYSIGHPDQFVDNVFRLPVPSEAGTKEARGNSKATPASDAVPAQPTGTKEHPVAVTSAEQYTALPPGSFYTDSHGKLARKP